MFENRALLSTARWLLTAEEEQSTGRVFHHAYYRPDLNRNSQNIINGLICRRMSLMRLAIVQLH